MSTRKDRVLEALDASLASDHDRHLAARTIDAYEQACIDDAQEDLELSQRRANRAVAQAQRFLDGLGMRRV